MTNESEGTPEAESRAAAQEQAGEVLVQEIHFFCSLMEHFPDRIYFKDLQSRFIYGSQSFARFFQLDFAAIEGKTDFDFFSEAHAQAAFDDEQEIIQTGVAKLNLEEKETWPDGRVTWCSTSKVPFRDPQGRIIGILGISRDISIRKQAQEALRESETRSEELASLNRQLALLNQQLTLANREMKIMSLTDSLTGLWNRSALLLTLDRILKEIQRSAATPNPKLAALLYLDLDNLKRVNDTLGHALGDGVLKVVATRMAEILRPSDVIARADPGDDESVARIHGDEFCLILKGLSHPLDAGRVARRVLNVLRQPILLEGHELVVNPSIGIALIPQDGQDPDTLLKNADRAMYAAKETGRNCFQFFEPNMGTRMLEIFALETSMRRGLLNGAFHVHFQPQVDARDQSIIGMEALLRWDDPEMGSISPSKFIPVAEESGLIVELGEFVIMESLTFIQSLQAEGFPPVRVAVNLSSVQMLDPRLLDRIENCIALTGADPHCLEMEITESILLAGSDHSLAILNRMKALGITLALDDFGTGYSSLSYLQQFPFDVIKIDQSFVQSLSGASQGRNLVAAIIAMGKSLGMELVAEGVEQTDQANFFLDRGCHKIQGFLYCRPMSPEAFRAFYRERMGDQPPHPSDLVNED